MRPNQVAGLALLALAAVGYYLTTTFPAVPEMLSQNVPPTFFPRLVLGALALSALALLVPARGEPARPDPIRAEILVTAALLVVFVWLMPRFGMLATASLVAIVLPIYWGERRKLVVGGLAVGLPLALYLIFVLALGMRLPRGYGW